MTSHPVKTMPRVTMVIASASIVITAPAVMLTGVLFPAVLWASCVTLDPTARAEVTEL